jgi:hypothetical protein
MGLVTVGKAGVRLGTGVEAVCRGGGAVLRLTLNKLSER